MNLYALLIAPLENGMSAVLDKMAGLFESYGWAVVFLSVAINLALVPLRRLSKSFRDEDLRIREAMTPEIKKIRAYYHGRERYFYEQSIRRRYGLNLWSSVRVPLSFLIQIPILLAAFQCLYAYTPFHGEKFWFVEDLGSPDKALFGFALLPVLMACINILNVLLSRQENSTSKSLLYIGGSIGFSVLLYSMSAGLLLFWTTGNLFSLVASKFSNVSSERRRFGTDSPRFQRLGIVVFSAIFPALFYIQGNLVLLGSFSEALVVAFCFLGLAVFCYVVLNLCVRPWFHADGRSYLCAALVLIYSFNSTFSFKEVYVDSSPLRNIALFVLMSSALYLIFAKALVERKRVLVLLLALSVAAGLNGVFGLGDILESPQRVAEEILNVEFKRKPNVYWILPDSYANSKTLEGLNIDNKDFEMALEKNGFELYPEFYASYEATAYTVPSTLNMAHHYYINSLAGSELRGGRDIASGINNVNRIFKNNGYTTLAIHETSYLLGGRPCRYDGCWPETKIPLLLQDTLIPDFLNVQVLNTKADRERSFSYWLEKIKTKQRPTFMYLHYSLPAHTHNRGSCDNAKELAGYRSRLKKSNAELEQTVQKIIEQDPEGVVMVVADHGGYVLDNCTSLESLPKNALLIGDRQSAFAAIHWGALAQDRIYAEHIKSTVTLFSVLFAALADEETLLDMMAPDNSYLRIGGKTYETMRNGVKIFPPELAPSPMRALK